MENFLKLDICLLCVLSHVQSMRKYCDCEKEILLVKGMFLDLAPLPRYPSYDVELSTSLHIFLKITITAPP
jgi:hypothetical protein